MEKPEELIEKINESVDLLEKLIININRVNVQTKLPDGATCETPFGVPRTGIGYGQPITHPLAEATLSEIENNAWPDPANVDVSQIREAAMVHDGQYAILGGDWSPFWHDLIDLLGMENMYMKMYDQPELVDKVLSHLVDYYFESSRRIFDKAADVIDIFFIGNDFRKHE